MSLPFDFPVVAAIAVMPPVTTDARYLHRYGYALRWAADYAERAGHPATAARYRARAYHFRTLARRQWWEGRG